LARHRGHRREDALVRDPALAQLALHHPRSLVAGAVRTTRAAGPGHPVEHRTDATAQHVTLAAMRRRQGAADPDADGATLAAVEADGAGLADAGAELDGATEAEAAGEPEGATETDGATVALGEGDGDGETYGVNTPPVPKKMPLAKIRTKTRTVPITKYFDALSRTRIDGSIGIAWVADADRGSRGARPGFAVVVDAADAASPNGPPAA